MLNNSRLGLAGLSIACSLYAQDPVAHWSFDSGAPWIAGDVTDHGFDLVAIQKKDALLLVDGVVGKALAPSDTGFQIFVREGKSAFNFAAGSLEAVVFHIPTTTTQMIFSNTTFRPGVAEGYHFHIASGGRIGFNTGNSFNLTRWSVLQSSQAMLPRRAYHLAATFNDNGVNHLYIDGVEVGSTPFIPYLPSTDLVRVGQTYGDFLYQAYLKSPIDEVKVYDQALSGAEIQAHYLEVQAAIDRINAAQP